MIASGSVITFDIAGTTGQWVPRTAADVRKDVIDNLTPNFDVISLQVNRSTGLLGDPINLYYWEWPYTAVLVAMPRSDYGDVRDVDSVVAHGFYLAGGQMPTVTARSEGETQEIPITEPPGVLGSISGITAWLVLGAIAVAVIVVASRVPR